MYQHLRSILLIIIVKGKETDITECPHCGHNEVYIKCTVKGISEIHQTLDGTEPCNDHIHDSLIFTEQKTVYCEQCNTKLGMRLEDGEQWRKQ